MKNLLRFISTLVIMTILATPAFAVELPLRVVVNSEKLSFPDAQPFIDASERLQIPSRFIGQSLGAKVSWDGQDQKATFVKGGTSLVLFIGKSEYQVNGQKKYMDTKALLKNGRIFVPARYVAEAFGAGVAWDKAIRTVYINTDGSVPTITPTSKKDPVTGWIKVETDKTYVEYSMIIAWDPEAEILNARYDAAEEMFSERYGKDIAKQIFTYVRQKQTRAYDLPRKKFTMGDQTITVGGGDFSSSIQVWKQGIVLQ